MSVNTMRIKKGDSVMIRSGKYKGQSGLVIATHPTEGKVTVEGINIVKKHVKPSKSNPQGGIIEMTKPIWVSKVGLLAPGGKKPLRVGYKLNSDGKKVRVFKPSNKEVK